MRRLLVAAIVLLSVAGSPQEALAGAGRAPAAVYWLGTSFDSLPLVAEPGFPPSFIYERCGPGSPASCEVQVQNWLLRSTHPRSYDLPCERLRVRGVPALFDRIQLRLDLYTGRRTVRIFGGSRRQVVRAANALRVRGSSTVRTRNLPRPEIPVAAALRRCRAAPAALSGRG